MDPSSDQTPGSLRLPAAVIFLSAFLLFQVQPLVGKMVLPWFGGSAGVWTTCLLFFQLSLLLGYAYSHFLVIRLPAAWQGRLHGSLLLLACLALPVRLHPAFKPLDPGAPVARLLGLLALTVGLPYFLLSTTGPLVQAWVARRGRVPYRLFALSNLASLLALLSYPVLVEPFLSLRTQAWAWSAGFVVFALLAFLLARASGRGAEPPVETELQDPAPGTGRKLLWVLLAALPSLLLMAVTSHLSTNVAPIPFLWVLPLSLYLLSFILCFDSDRWYHRGVFLPLLALALPGLAALTHPDLLHSAVRWQVLAFSAGLFVVCMAAHGELARLRPAPARLTGFYLSLSLGGGLGGAFVALAAPRLFHSNLELPLGLALAAALVFVTLARDPAGLPPWPRRGLLLFWALLFGGLGAFAFKTDLQDARNSVARGRNFYGTLSVYDRDGGTWRTLSHGTITHGGQFLDPAKARKPATYYGPDSGIGLAIRSLPEGPRRLGVVGLGAGSLAAWGRKGDLLRFYEINPMVEPFARRHFTYLGTCEARTEVALGDARLCLERESPQDFDLLAVDAFSSDAIPVHLLTREAFATYLRSLAPGGVLAVHISNKYIALSPVVRAAAIHFGLRAIEVQNEGDDDEGIYTSDWVLLSRNHAAFTGKLFQESPDVRHLEARGLPWTDDFSNLFRALK
ncbi:MAG: fused MFS/spermidine synthase [Acidobacteria bacterium]|nr:fused MFS/spermidine synthase [Acidobacteriota bacterium]